MDSNLELLLSMVDNQSGYVVSKIQNVKNQWTYSHAMSELFDSMSDKENYFVATNCLAVRIIKVRSQKFGWDLFGQKRKYTELAIKHVKDIVLSIDTRFVRGGSKSYDIW